MEIKIENCMGIKDKDGKFYGLIALPASMVAIIKIGKAFDKYFHKQLFVFGMEDVKIEYEQKSNVE